MGKMGKTRSFPYLPYLPHLPHLPYLFLSLPISAYCGTSSSGMGSATNNRRHGAASQRAHRADRAWRALSVAMPVFAYICR